MKTYKINISNGGGVYTNWGRERLFSFDRVNDSCWVFYLPGRTREEMGNKIIENLCVMSEEIPVRHILEFTRCILTIRYGELDFDIELMKGAKKFLKIK